MFEIIINFCTNRVRVYEFTTQWPNYTIGAAKLIGIHLEIDDFKCINFEYKLKWMHF